MRCGRRTAVALVVACAACVPEEPPRPVAELRVPIDRDVRTLDPAEALDIVTHNVLRLLYEGLVDYDPQSLRIVPRVATSWTVADDGLRWTFQIAEGIRFVDDPCFPGGRGRAVTAEDARYSIEHGLRRYRGAAPAAELPPLHGLAEYLAGASARVSGMQVPDQRTLVLDLARPDARLLHYLARPGCFLVAREAVERYGAGIARRAVGSGPFRLASWNPSSGLLLVRRDGYWASDESGRPLPRIDALRFLVVQDSHRLYARGRADLFYAYRGETEDVEAGGISGDERRFRVPWFNTIYLRFDYRSGHPLVRDPRLRRALSLAAPRKTSVLHVPARGLLPPGLPGHRPAADGQRTDLDEARRLLRDAGRDLPPLRLVFPYADGNTGRQLADALGNLGVVTELQFRGAGELRRIAREGGADLFRDGWVADDPDPQNFLQLFHSRSPDNLGGYDNPAYDEAFERLREEANPERRAALAGAMERRLLEDTAAIFLRHEGQVQYVSPRVTNWEHNCTNPLNLHFYERVGLRSTE